MQVKGDCMRNFSKFELAIIIILVVVSCTPFSPATIPVSTSNSPTSTSTPYIPVSKGTDFPLLYEKITPESAHLVKLIASWRIDSRVGKLTFASNRDVLCVETESAVQSWDVFIRIDLAQNYCQELSIKGDGTKTISPSDHYSIKIEYGDLEIVNLLKPSTSLYYYLGSAAKAWFSPQGDYLIISFQNGQIWFVPKSEWEDRLLSLDDGNSDYDDNLRPELTIDLGRIPEQIVFSPDNSLLAFIFSDQLIQIWTVSNLSLYSTISGMTLPVSDVSGDPSSAGDENEIADKKTQSDLKRIVFAPNNLILATASVDNQIRLWDIRTGNLLAQLHSDALNSTLVFSPTSRLLASLHNGNLVNIWGIPPRDFETAKVEATNVAVSALVATPSISSFPKPTSTPTSALLAIQPDLPLDWPVFMPTKEQIVEARECSIDTLVESRYPEKMSYWELENAYPMETSCDWAVLAAAYISHFDDRGTVPEEGKRAFFESIKLNPAFAMTASMFYSYFNTLELVDVLPSARQPITSVVIDYEWGGMGDPSHIQYHVEIDKANSSIDQIKLSVQAQPDDLTNKLAHSVDPESVQEIGRALKDFLPVQSPFALQNCSDNYPDWKMKLTFLDNTTQTLQTSASNFFTVGGPWFVELNGQAYIQFSSALVNAVADLFETLSLPLGQPYAMTCSSVEILELAFP
jgi:WD40 repeat protein